MSNSSVQAAVLGNHRCHGVLFGGGRHHCGSGNCRHVDSEQEAVEIRETAVQLRAFIYADGWRQRVMWRMLCA